MQHCPLPTRRHTTRLGRVLSTVLRPGDLVILEGDLGAGKTFLTRALCRGLGLPSSERVTSPTFTLALEHDATIAIVHADLYRIADEEELWHLGLADRRAEGALLIVEWGAPFLNALGGDALVVSLSVSPREARLRATGPTSKSRLSSIDLSRVAAGERRPRKGDASPPSDGGTNSV